MEILDLLLLAAGKGTRIGAPVSKQFLDLCGKPVMIHALAAFEGLAYVGTKYVAVHSADVEYARRLLREHQITNCEIVRGGKTRQESVRRALRYVRTKRVITHNAVLPFVTRRLIDNVVQEDYPCVTTVTPAEYNLCYGDEFAEQAVPRERLKVINTPQSFQTEAFLESHWKAYEDRLNFNTDCELMMHYGHQVKFVPGAPENFKITTPMDVILARAIMSADCDPT